MVSSPEWDFFIKPILCKAQEALRKSREKAHKDQGQWLQQTGLSGHNAAVEHMNSLCVLTTLKPDNIPGWRGRQVRSLTPVKEL